MDLSKIGKCELCVLAKQVRARMTEIGEKAKDTGTWDDETDERIKMYERCAANLETTRDMLHRFESRKHMPLRNIQDELAGIGSTEDRQTIEEFYTELIEEAIQLIGWSPSQTQP